jgi:ABC-type dipeptide/oligopeptide/nickel transport system permease subunit
MAPLIVQMTMQFPGQIIATSSLAYIGLGIQPPTPEWGAMLNSAKEYITKAPLTILIPGIAIIIAVLCLNMIGDGMRDALDPRLKK